jgi:hypothetical protein
MATTRKRVATKKAGKAKAKSKSRVSNVDKLVKAGVLDASDMSDKHKDIVNKRMTAAEIKALIKAKTRIGSGDPWRPDASGAAF